MKVPTNAYRIFTGPDGVKRLHFISSSGKVIQLEPGDKAGLPDGYYTPAFKPIGANKLGRRLRKRVGADIFDVG